ncbi:MAG: carbohydrate porin [Oceanospirillaceae bacterium]|nr:carbohydrate porin [Oceanospirillaceae bacterium]
MKARTSARGTLAFRTSLALLVCAAVPAQAADLNSTFSIDANVEIDTDAVDYGEGSTKFEQGGRVEANLRGEIRSESHFVRGKGTLILAKDSDTHTDDMWIQFGDDFWDLQFGRFEAIDLFPKGKDTLLVRAAPGEVQFYEANLSRGRAGTDGGQIALHLNGNNGFGFELATLFGDDNVDSLEGTNEDAVTGVRPVVFYNGDGYSARIGLEYKNVEFTDGSEIDQQGVGGNLSFSVGEALVNLNAAWLDDNSDPFNPGDRDLEEVLSLGANLVYGRFGVGLIHSETDYKTGSDPSGTTLYAAYTMPLFDIDNASVTFAVSGSQANDVSGDDSAYGGRLRFNYTF